MNANTLSQHYKKLTPEERARLNLAAFARADFEEVVRLMDTCPQMTLIGPDPEYPKRLFRVRIENTSILLRWTEASHIVCRSWLIVHFHALVAEAYDSQRVAGAATGNTATKPKARVRQCRALANKAQAEYKSWSGIWKGIESGIAKFCTESDLPADQLFAMNEPLSPVIEQAREIVAADVALDRAMSESIHDRLRRAML